MIAFFGYLFFLILLICAFDFIIDLLWSIPGIIARWGGENVRW